MANFYSGSNGTLHVGEEDAALDSTTEVAKVQSWSFTLNTAVLETTSIGDFDRELIPGVSSTTGSCNIYYYATETTGSNNADRLSSKIFDSILPRSDTTSLPVSQKRLKVKFRFEVDNAHYLELKAVLTSLTMTNAVGEIMTAEVNFEGDGIPTENKY
tara:strand:- start:536 stop:1009 length:474 start_codon:yes stop_codon:yes gene_type:complete